MALHGSHILGITSSKTLVMQTFSVPNEISLVLVSHFLGNQWLNIPRKSFGSPSKKLDNKKEEEKKTRTEIAELFPLHANSITRSLNMVGK